jgi:hypothetical protein
MRQRTIDEAWGRARRIGPGAAEQREYRNDDHRAAPFNSGNAAAPETRITDLKKNHASFASVRCD